MKPATDQPIRPDEDQRQPVTPEVERIVRERLADAGPTRPWDEFYADEKRRKAQTPTAR
jgi:hypothetical protein